MFLEDVNFDKNPNIQQICRTCGVFFDKSIMIPTFEKIKITTTSSDEFELIDEITLLNIEIKEYDGLPQQVCVNCVQELTKIHNFRQKCKKAQMKLKECFGKKIRSEVSSSAITSNLENPHNETNPEDMITHSSDQVNNFLNQKFENEKNNVEDSDMDNCDIMHETNDNAIDDEVDDENKDVNLMIKKLENEIEILSQPLKLFKSKKKPEKKVKNNQNCRKDIYRCDECDEAYKYRFRLLKHKRLTHSDGYNYECALCFKKFINAYKFNYHLKSHNPDEKYKCQYCEKRFNQLPHLKYHEETHTRVDNPHKCEVCDEKFIHRSNLLIHKALKHSENKAFICETCGQGFAAKYILNAHIRNFHRRFYATFIYECEICGKIKKYKGKKPNECCGQQLKSKPIKKQVERPRNNNKLRIGNEKFYNCPKCPKKFSVPSGLETHLKVHDENRKYSCVICKISFLTLSHLQTHNNRLHSKRLVYKCTYCNKEFYDSSTKNEHVKFVHIESKKKCSYCGKEVSARYIKKHELAHTNEKHCKCLICGQEFSVRFKLNSHYKTHSLEEKEKMKEKILNSVQSDKI